MTSITFNDELVHPSKIICIGKNYVAHIEEMNSVPSEQMTVFMKPRTSITNTLTAYRDEQIHFEGEICFVIGKGRIEGVGFGLDLTKRGLQGKLKQAGLPWERAKAFSGAALFSKFVPAPLDMENLILELWIDGELRQSGGPSLMIYRPDTIMKDLQSFLTLEDGDVVMTGTPAGVGAISSGAHFKGRILDGSHELVSQEWIAT